MDFSALLQDPAFWASLIGLFFPKVYDYFELLLQWIGAYDFFDTPARKSILAWIIAVPVAYGALLLVKALWPASVEFNFDTLQLMAKSIVAIVIIGTLSLPSYKNRGLLVSSSNLPITPFWKKNT